MLSPFNPPYNASSPPVVVQFEKNDSYQGIALAMPPK
jgi:hypothetical protein